MTVYPQEVPGLLVSVLMDAATRGVKPYSDATIYSFPQTWADGSTGFGGMATQSIVTTQTVAILTDDGFLVYISGKYAYTCTRQEGYAFFSKLRFPGKMEYDSTVN